MTNLAKQRHDLEIARFQAAHQLPFTKEAEAQAIFDLHRQQDELMGYENGFAGLVARFTGRREEKLEQLRANLRHGEAQRDALRREAAALEHTIRKTDAALAELPPWTVLDAPRWESRVCARMLLPLLKDNHSALAEARKSLRGERAGQIMSRQEFQEFYGAADRTGEACAVLVQRLHELGGLSEIPPYYRAPTAYTANAATTYIRLDRVNEAMGQCLRLQSAMEQLLQAPEPADLDG